MYSWLAQAYQTFLEMRQNGRLSHALLICGKAGLGVTQLAHEIARTYLCVNNGIENCTCHSCAMLKAGTHPDFIIVNRGAGASIGIDAQRQGCSILETTAVNAHGKVLLIEDAEFMTEQAANALLKTLEEPPANTFIILTTGQVGSLLPTILSRTMKLNIAEPPVSELNLFLQQELQTEETFDLELAITGMSPLKVLQLVQAGDHQKLHTAMEAFAKVVTEGDAPMNFVQCVDRVLAPELLFGMLYGIIHDVMLYQSGVAIAHLHVLRNYPAVLEKLSLIHPDSLAEARKRIIALKRVPGVKVSMVAPLQLISWLELFACV